MTTATKSKPVKKKSITEQVKTFNDACKLRKLDPKNLPNVSMLPKEHRKSIMAFYMLTVIIEALNEGWTPNWKNGNEAKYYPYFDLSSGFGFSDTAYSYTDTFTGVGSRLCFKTRELSDYSGKQFEAIYKDLLILEN